MYLIGSHRVLPSVVVPLQATFQPTSSYCFSFPPCLTKSLSCPLSLMPPLECVGGTLLLSLPIVPCLNTTRWAGPKTGPYYYNYYYADYFNSFTTNIMYLLAHIYEFQYSNKVALRVLSRSYRLLLFHVVFTLPMKNQWLHVFFSEAACRWMTGMTHYKWNVSRPMMH